jgi:hypothetical protein
VQFGSNQQFFKGTLTQKSVRPKIANILTFFLILRFKDVIFLATAQIVFSMVQTGYDYNRAWTNPKLIKNLGPKWSIKFVCDPGP